MIEQKQKIMTVNDIKMDIITVINQLSDASIFRKIRNTIQREVNEKQITKTAIWKGADTEIRKGVSFKQFMKEQNYENISFEEFIESDVEDAWEVPIDELLNNAN